MGEEIRSRQFNLETERAFKARVREELEVLRTWFARKHFEERDDHFGLELEGWLFDPDGTPTPKNHEFLTHVNDPHVVHEISKFNIEINSEVHILSPHLLSEMHQELSHWSRRLQKSAADLNLQVGWIGIPPTLRSHQLTLENMTPSNRYYALAERVMELRGGKSVHFDIHRKDQIQFDHPNVMMEAAATSVQFHTQVRLSESVAHYNAAQLLAAPLVAISANSPFLFEKKLWDETRIPIFEQALSLTGYGEPHLQDPVTFGKGWVRESLIEIFEDNLTYPALLCPLIDEPTDQLRHLKLLNGQVWRWNRPIIGIPSKMGQKPSLRIEHRPLAAGPSSLDAVASFAFYLGLLKTYARKIVRGEIQLPEFQQARSNFYACAQWGMKAQVTWVDGQSHNIQNLLLERLLPEALEGLRSLGIAQKDQDEYLNRIMAQRIRTGWSGAAWQKSYIDTHGADFSQMMQAYLENQASGQSVIDWKV